MPLGASVSMPDEPQQPENTNEGTPPSAGDAFLRPRLTGDRFSQHTIPLELLKDLSTLEAMLIDIAKAQYFKANPNRKRVPKGFTDGVSLSLTGVEEGSAIPVLALAVASSSMLFDEARMYLLEARQAFFDGIQAAERADITTVRDNLPESVLARFNSFGVSLQPGEAIEFEQATLGVANDRPTIAKLTPSSRETLVWASEVANELMVEARLRGLVHEANQETETFQIKLNDGKILHASIEDEYADTVAEAWNGYRRGQRVAIHGIVSLNRRGNMQRIEHIDEIVVLDPLDFESRIDDLRGLKDGWLDGHGVAPIRPFLDWMVQKFDGNYDDELPLPYVYPTEDGGIRMEWSIDEFEASLEGAPSTPAEYYRDLNRAAGAEQESSLDLNQARDWGALNTLLASRNEAARDNA